MPDTGGDLSRFELALRGTRLGLWDWDMLSGSVVINDRWAQIVGCTAADLEPITIATWTGLTHPEDLARSEISIHDHVSGRAPFYDVEARMRHRDGHWVWIRDRGEVVAWTDDGRPARMVGTHEDITERVLAQEEAAAASRRLSAMFDDHEATMLLIDADTGAIVQANRSAATFYGYPVEHLRTMNIADLNQLDPEEVGRRRTQALSGIRQHFVFPHRLADGTIREVEVHSSPIRDGNRTLLFSIIRDVTEREEYEARLRTASTFFDHALEGVAIIDTKRTFVSVNAAFLALTGYARDDLIGQPLEMIRIPGEDLPSDEAARQAAASGRGFRAQRLVRRADGGHLPALLSVNPIPGPLGEITGYVAQIADITDRVRQEQHQLEHLRFTDSTTGLPNRLLFTDTLDAEFRSLRMTHATGALVLVNLDRFKEVNDAYGFEVGESVVAAIAQRLAGALRSGDVLARNSGDEFAILLRGVKSAHNATEVARGLLRVVEAPCTVAPDATVFMTACAGIVMLPGSMAIGQEALQRAAAALHAAKASGPSSIQHHVQALVTDSRDRLSRATQLVQGWRNDELSVAYQPQVDVASGHLVGVEALLRWHSPTLGVIPPSDFIPVAESTGLIGEIGRWVLREACRQGTEWTDAGLDAIRVSVNVAAQQLVPGEFVAEVSAALTDAAFDPRRLVLELTESALLHASGDTVSLLSALGRMGVRLAIDDFGTGYSSFSYLRQYPLDKLKIDRSFIEDLATNRDTVSIAAAIIEMGHTLGLRVLAEGVETEDQRVILQELGCDLYQGYLTSPAVPPEQIPALVAGRT